MTDQEPNLNEVQFEILRFMVQRAKDLGLQSVDTLRMHANKNWPGHTEDVEAAIQYWGAYEARKRDGSRSAERMRM